MLILLPSNASLDVVPENTLQHYKMKLNVPINIKGEYEVGIMDIMYPTGWYNITDG